MKNRKKQQAEERPAEKNKQDVFLVIAPVDYEWLKAEAERRAKERYGYVPANCKVQPVIYDLILEAWRASETALA